MLGPGSLQGLLNILNLLGSPPTAAGRAPEAINKMTGAVIPNGAVMLVWTGDNIVDDGKADSDFLAVVDAEPNVHPLWPSDLDRWSALRAAG